MNNPISNFKKLLLGLATDIQLRREGKKLDARIREHMLNQNIVLCREPGVSSTRYLPNSQVIVSLTTFGPRIREVARAIESIMEQTLKPNRIILWLNQELEHSPHLIPASLRLLEKRGLEILFTEDIGAAKKLIPALRKFPNDVIITIDDDSLYDIDLIDRLLTAHLRFPKAVCAGRIDRLVLTKDSKSLSVIYDRADDLYLTSQPLMQPIAVGVGGVLYPPHSLHPDVFNIELMRKLTPKADDLWFKTMELLAGTPVFPANELNPTDVFLLQSRHYRLELALYTTNFIGRQDDVQLRALTGHYPQLLDFYRS